jgi:hypothetical protein
MSKISADTVEAKTTNGDLVLQGNGTGVPDLASGTKLNGTALTDTFSTQSPVGANLIINGDMRIAQRGTVSSIGAPSYGGCDRFQLNLSGVANFTLEQSTDAPANTQFKNSQRLTVGTGDAVGTASDFALIRTMFEGQDLHQFKKGTTNAEQFTLQFWVRSSVTGTYIVRLWDNDNNRAVSKSYTISSADTWEYVTLTFPADTTGAFDDDNGRSLIIQWYVAAGSNYTSGTLSEVWAAKVDANGVVGQVNGIASTSNIFALTGVKLEVGDTATAFVPDDYSTALAKCQRYFQLFGFGMPASCDLTTNVSIPFHTSVPMRTTSPTFVIENTSFQIRSNNAVRTASSPAVVGATAGDGSGFWKQINGLASLTGGHAGLVYTVNAFSADAEL